MPKGVNPVCNFFSLAEVDGNKTKYVGATIAEVEKRERWKIGNTVMICRTIHVIPDESNGSSLFSLDATEISHVFLDRLTVQRFANTLFSIKHENLAANL